MDQTSESWGHLGKRTREFYASQNQEIDGTYIYTSSVILGCDHVTLQEEDNADG